MQTNCTNWIFFTSRELGLLRELSELCGTQKNHMPNISVYDLQHLSKERREALVLAGRLKPCKVSMLDIDRFGDRSYTLLEHEKRERMERNHLTFELREDIKKKYIPQLPSNPFERSPFTIPGNRPGEPFDIDATIQAIDKKIAELEAEEKREKEARDQKAAERIDADKKGDNQ